jgi:Na+/proline symporter
LSMSPIAKLLIIPLVAAVVGIFTAFFVGRAPMSGRVAIALLCFPVLSILLLGVEFGSDIVRESVAGALFGFSVPVCFAYSLHAWRRAPDRRAALAGFAGSILFSLAYLLMMPQLAFHFVRELSGAGGSH